MRSSEASITWLLSDFLDVIAVAKVVGDHPLERIQNGTESPHITF